VTTDSFLLLSLGLTVNYDESVALQPIGKTTNGPVAPAGAPLEYEKPRLSGLRTS
jgi:hypothetical protein